MPLNDPVPSSAADVLERNSRDFDRFVVGTANTFVTRLGVTKLTITGIIDRALRQSWLLWPPIEYAAGLEITTSRQTYWYDNGTGRAIYNWVGDIPFTTSGDFEADADWNLIQAKFTSDYVSKTGAEVSANSDVIDVWTYEVGKNSLALFKNGSLQSLLKNDYSELSTTEIEITQPYLDSDLFEVRGINFLGQTDVRTIDALNVVYNNFNSGLSATDAKNAIDELAAIDDSQQTQIDSLISDVSDIDTLAGSDTASLKSGVLVKDSKILTLAKGSRTWWNEPAANAIGDAFQRCAVGFCGVDGSISVASVDESSTTYDTKVSSVSTQYDKDEHNNAVVFEHNGKLFIFYDGHQDDGKIYMRRSTDLSIDNLEDETVILNAASGSVGYTQVTSSDGGGVSRLVIYFRNLQDNWDMLVSEDDGDTWDLLPLFTNSGGDQLYIRAQPVFSDGSLHRIVLTKNASVSGNSIYEARISFTASQIVPSTGPTGSVTTFPERTTSASRIDLTSLNEIYTPSLSHIRLLQSQYSFDSTRILVAEFNDSDNAEYRYIEYDPSTDSITHNSKIVDSGRVIGSSTYFAGGCFTNVDRGGTLSIGPVFIARKDGDTWKLEEYRTNDSGDSWYLSELIRERTDAKIWRPYVPLNTRNKYSSNQIDLTWCEGSYPDGPGVPGYFIFDSYIMARKRFVSPFDLQVDSLSPSERVAPQIVSQPSNQSGADGTTATFSVTASSSSPVWFQWQISTDGGSTFTNSGASDANEPTISTTINSSSDGRLYRCLVGNNFGYDTSDSASVTLI